MVHQQLDQHQSAIHSLGHRQAAGMGYSIGVSGPRSLPPVSCVGMARSGPRPYSPMIGAFTAAPAPPRRVIVDPGFLSYRDRAALRILYRADVATTSQLTTLVYTRRQTAQERLSALYRAGYLERAILPPSTRGGAPYAFRVSPRGRRRLGYLPLTRSRAGSQLRHSLNGVETVCALVNASRGDGSSEPLVQAWLTEDMAHDLLPEDLSRWRRRPPGSDGLGRPVSRDRPEHRARSGHPRQARPVRDGHPLQARLAPPVRRPVGRASRLARRDRPSEGRLPGARGLRLGARPARAADPRPRRERRRAQPECGSDDPSVPFSSTRHRGAARRRSAPTPGSRSWALGGHEDFTEALR